jgi:light-regulated signal transduction histidine kinase (bacteriophytochrome)
MLNKLLHRQIRKSLGDFEALPEKYKELFMAISESYDFYEKDRRMLERSIELSSDEMIGLYKQLKQESDETIQKSEANLELKNTELERKNKELEQFAFIASHDLQEPLRTIGGFVDLLNKQYYGKLDAKADKYINYILQASDRMKILIKDLLDFSRIGVKKEFEPIDCTIMLHEVLADLGKAIKETNADIKSDPLPVISGYSTEIQQLFQNLITNAIKFRKKDTRPQIRISAKRIKGYWEFAFRDNGIGIDEKHNEKIFIIFQRLHTRGEYKGSGIGLSHCKKIVELHGGKIWVQSAPGDGSTFNFTISESPALTQGN